MKRGFLNWRVAMACLALVPFCVACGGDDGGKDDSQNDAGTIVADAGNTDLNDAGSTDVNDAGDQEVSDAGGSSLDDAGEMPESDAGGDLGDAGDGNLLHGEAIEEGDLDSLAKASGHVVARSALERAGVDSASADEIRSFTRTQREFNAELFRRVAGNFEGRNAMISAMSVHQALGMTYAGARNETARQMSEVLGFGDNSHGAQNALSLTLESRNIAAIGSLGQTSSPGQEGGGESSGGSTGGAGPSGSGGYGSGYGSGSGSSGGQESYDAVELSIANAIWAQKGIGWKADFLDALSMYYGAGMELLDFQGALDDSRKYINAWVASKTRDRIKDIIAPGGLSSDTVTVLTNAIYFKAPWLKEFSTRATQDDEFETMDGGKVVVPFVASTEYLPYASGGGWVAVQKPFRGNKLAMLFILPSKGTFGEFSEAMDADAFDEVVDGLDSLKVELKVPKFRFTTDMRLDAPLKSMGMEMPFAEGAADFSGMTDEIPIWIDKVIHKTFIALDERGVEAAAATVVAGSGGGSAPTTPVPVVLDSPFLFAVRDVETGAVLFYGQVMDPSEE